MDREKEVLCCFRDKRRPETFCTEEGKPKLKLLIDAVTVVFQHIIPSVGTVFLQLKNEDWAGEFTDVHERDSIPNHAVLRVVVKKSSPEA